MTDVSFLDAPGHLECSWRSSLILRCLFTKVYSALMSSSVTCMVVMEVAVEVAVVMVVVVVVVVKVVEVVVVEEVVVVVEVVEVVDTAVGTRDMSVDGYETQYKEGHIDESSLI